MPTFNKPGDNPPEKAMTRGLLYKSEEESKIGCSDRVFSA
jgi:hypothetical protein